jgi:hypothetical protein
MRKTTQKFPESNLVEVDWRDSASRGRWDTLDNYKKEVPALCRSAGYMIVKNTRVVILLQTQSINTLNDALDAITIPRGCITRIRKLK